MRQKKAPAGKQGRKAKEQMKMYLSWYKYTKNLLNHQTINELLIIVALLCLIGLILLKGGII